MIFAIATQVATTCQVSRHKFYLGLPCFVCSKIYLLIQRLKAKLSWSLLWSKLFLNYFENGCQNKSLIYWRTRTILIGQEIVYLNCNLPNLVMQSTSFQTTEWLKSFGGITELQKHGEIVLQILWQTRTPFHRSAHKEFFKVKNRRSNSQGFPAFLKKVQTFALVTFLCMRGWGWW